MKPDAKKSSGTNDEGNLEKRLVENLLKDLGFGEKEPNNATTDIMTSFKVLLEKYRSQHNLTGRGIYDLGVELCNEINRRYSVPSLVTKMRYHLKLRYTRIVITSI